MAFSRVKYHSGQLHPPYIGVCPEYEDPSAIGGDKPCHEMARIGTNRRSHQQLVTGPVTNWGLLTRNIRFRTAPSPLVSRNGPGHLRIPPSPIVSTPTPQGCTNGTLT